MSVKYRNRDSILIQERKNRRRLRICIHVHPRKLGLCAQEAYLLTNGSASASHVKLINNLFNKDDQYMSIFRQKSMDRISSPEQLNDYIRVTTPSVWLVLIAIILLLAGMLAWSVLGTVEAHAADGSTEEIHPITLVTN